MRSASLPNSADPHDMNPVGVNNSGEGGVGVFVGAVVITDGDMLGTALTAFSLKTIMVGETLGAALGTLEGDKLGASDGE